MESLNMAQSPSTSAVMALQLELKKIHEEPVEGFQVFPHEDNIFEWDVVIFGPPCTLYESGYFKAKMTFPPDYPYSPPSVRFVTKMWHPNVYQNGDVCISILHPPVDDPQSGELPSERWNPTQTVRTILLSVISLLNEPNTSSPANVDASVMFRKWKDSRGRDNQYENIIKEQVAKTRPEAERDGVKVPTTLAEYCIAAKPQASSTSDTQDGGDFYVDDFHDDYGMEEEEDEEGDGFYEDDEEDSGNGES